MTPTNTPEPTAGAAPDGAASRPDPAAAAGAAGAAGSAGEHVPPLDPTELSKDPV